MTESFINVLVTESLNEQICTKKKKKFYLHHTSDRTSDIQYAALLPECRWRCINRRLQYFHIAASVCVSIFSKPLREVLLSMAMISTMVL